MVITPKRLVKNNLIFWECKSSPWSLLHAPKEILFYKTKIGLTTAHTTAATHTTQNMYKM